MKRKIITGALVGCLAVSGLLGLSGCAMPDPYASYTKVTTDTFSAAINAEAESYHIKLEEGNYEGVLLNATNSISGEGTSDSPYIYQREINDFVLVGDGEDTVVDGFSFNQGLFVNYKPAGGVDYYHYDTFKIENLIIKDMVFTDHFIIRSELDQRYYENPTIQIENVVFENVTFDFEGVTSSNNGAFYLVNPNGGVDNVTFNKCSFQNCVGTNVMNAILVVSENTADDINLTVQNCNFESINYNAIQMSGVNSSFGGEIRILNNNINNTGDRAIRISTLGSTANFKMKDNIMTNASDADGELCKATIQSGARFVIKNNYWGAQIGLAPICGLVDGSAGGSMIADEEPRTTID